MKEIILTKDNIEEVIGKQIDQIASSAEVNALNRWRQSSVENEKYYQHIIQVNGWYTSMQSQEVDVDKAWKNVSRKINNNDTSKGRLTTIKLWRVMGYAASILLVVAAGFYFGNNLSSFQQETEFVALETSRNVELADGSMVRLSPNSALSKLESQERAFQFAGNAQFEVIHDDETPFVVYMDNVIVKDLGTIFDIDNQPLSDTVYVKVLEGLVQFYTKTKDGIMIEHGEEGMYIKSKDQFYKRSIDAKNPFLSVGFNNASFGEVIDHLAYSFRKKIQIENDSLRNCSISVDFSKSSFTVVKEIIEETLNVTIIKDDDTLFINGKGCK